MSVPTIPDAEVLIGQWLRQHPDIVALDARVAPGTPDSTTKPWVRVRQLDATDHPRSSIEHLVDYLVQLDCYAGKEATDDHAGQAEASRLTRTVRAALKGMQSQAVDGVVVTRVRFTGHARIPDTAFEQARERYVLTAEVMVHPA